jgi:2-polyprenyl-3-methyl-5-hydroxy-6-metoxy-1,4-benzoquinol methylase
MTPRQPLEWLMRHHRNSAEPVDPGIAALLNQHCPQDQFSKEMWRVGSSFYMKKLGVLLHRGATVLDVGCGTGCWSVAAAKLGATVTGIDLSAARIECAKEISTHLSTPQINYKNVSLDAQKIIGEEFDFVICNNTIQYISGFDHTVAQIGRVLKPGGTLILSSTDIGIIPYLTAESLCTLNPRKLLETYKALAKACQPFRRDLHNGAFIAESKMRRAMEHRGYQIHRDSEKYKSTGRLIPQRLMGMPLYYEAVYTLHQRKIHEK